MNKRDNKYNFQIEILFNGDKKIIFDYLFKQHKLILYSKNIIYDTKYYNHNEHVLVINGNTYLVNFVYSYKNFNNKITCSEFNIL